MSVECGRTGLAIVQSADRGSLPQLVVVDFVLAETMNALTRQLDHDDSVDGLQRLNTNVDPNGPAK